MQRILPKLSLIRLDRVPIFQQLQLEEALFRSDTGNYYVWNEGQATPTVVLGISGKPEQMLNLDSVQRDGVKMIKRYSGGGTVVVDDGTIFGTFICNMTAFPKVRPYPKDIMSWSGDFYAPLFNSFTDPSSEQAFRLREDDYVFGDRKFGGNAQSIIKGRWVHHTSFLWDFKRRNMDYLQLPYRQPKYRNRRDHNDFLGKLSSVIPAKDMMFTSLLHRLDQVFEVDHLTYDDVAHFLEKSHRKSTRWLNVEPASRVACSTSAII